MIHFTLVLFIRMNRFASSSKALMLQLLLIAERLYDELWSFPSIKTGLKQNKSRERRKHPVLSFVFKLLNECIIDEQTQHTPNEKKKHQHRVPSRENTRKIVINFSFWLASKLITICCVRS